MSVSLEQFVQHLAQSGLMSATEVSAFRDSFPPEKRPHDAETLARALVKVGKLTKYQAQTVYQGKTKGLVFGEYRVLDKLGQGGMGVVLKAEHRRMERTVAVKMISAAAMKSSDAVKRFYREVKAAARLMHPNIVTAFDAAEHVGSSVGNETLTAPSPFISRGSNWNLPPGAPSPAVAPFDAIKAKQHQVAWAEHLGVPVEETNPLEMPLVLIPPGEFEMRSTPEEIAWALEVDADQLRADCPAVQPHPTLYKLLPLVWQTSPRMTRKVTLSPNKAGHDVRKP